MYELVDTHAHLEEIAELGQAIDEAREAGVIAIVAVGSDYQSNQKVLALAEVYGDFVYPALGLHPWNLGGADIERNLEFIEAHIHRAVGIGEIGLDYHKRVKERAGKDLQMRVLREVLQLAKTYKKPAIIHSRYAWQDSLSLVTEAQLEKVVFHWYTGTSGVLRDIINHDYFISATPAVEYHKEHRRAVKEVPLSRLLLETDSPVAYGQGPDGLKYESRPVHVLNALRGAASLKTIDEAELAQLTTDNALKFFELPNCLTS
jgi:TatD DNase family protein